MSIDTLIIYCLRFGQVGEYEFLRTTYNISKTMHAIYVHALNT